MQGQVSVIESFPLISQSLTTIISKDSNNIEEAHVLSNKENNPPNFDVDVFLVPYDVILAPTSDPFTKPTFIAHLCVTTYVDKSLAILIVTPMVVTPTNLESPTMMQTSLLQHTLNAYNFKPLSDSVEIVTLPLTIEKTQVCQQLKEWF